ncbi:thioesterase II family protein [Streptomyces sp. RPT161]|uniref:thioesterase II family protein n=1 Tax=Streptomyces sp. RPT161 TaxID=3015993 RepID=UPI0022B8AD75|nr:thioesterase domain-containing protein [Streptomyces sp. RPT161]
MTAERWLRRPHPLPNAALRLVCLPHAGGSTGLYREWSALLPPRVELLLACPPGREDRLDDPIPADLPGLVSGLATAVAPLLDRPWAVFGHSMGAAVGHELVSHLLRQGHPAPVHLFVSAREAPQHHRRGTIHLLDDNALCAELARLGGTDAALLAMPELRQLVLPAIRGDYRLIENYDPQPVGLLPCPVTALIGADDTELTAEEADGWRDWTSAPFELLTFPGGHFYLSERPREVIAAIRRQLAGNAIAPP